jgi:hypothetical protein
MCSELLETLGAMLLDSMGSSRTLPVATPKQQFAAHLDACKNTIQFVENRKHGHDPNVQKRSMRPSVTLTRQCGINDKPERRNAILMTNYIGKLTLEISFKRQSGH